VWLEHGDFDMATGTIKKVVSDRGFGFITGEDGKDYFFHRDGLAESLPFYAITGGERVEFDLQASDRGPRAVNVRQAAG
jgi:CspA family cold shock protein